MSFLANTLRRFLAQKGYALLRIDAGLSATLESYLDSLKHRGIAIERAYIFDGDPEPLRIFLNVFEAQRVVFGSPAGPNFDAHFQQGEHFILEADVLAVCHPGPSLLSQYLEQASVVIIRSKLGQFWSGKADILDLTNMTGSVGFQLHEVIQSPATPLAKAAVENVFLIYERKIVRFVERRRPQRERAYRISEASNHLSVPIAKEADLTRLTGRGSHGFPVGLCNPGAIQTNQGLVLLARGERIPWPVQKHSRASFLSSCQPMLLSLQDDLQIAKAVEVRLPNTLGLDRSRFEDFRLFSHRDRIYSNHSIIRLDDDNDRKPIRPERLRTSIGVSQVDVANAILAPLGSPALDRPVARVEKNWAMVSTGEQVHLIYSFNPYRLFASKAFPDLNFTSTIERRLILPIPDDGLPIRNSINPIPYDSDHLLHIVHKVYPDKRYVFWAVLIDKRTLTPSKMVSRPLLRAGASATTSIIYACSAISRHDDLLVFAGLDDCAIGAWRVSKTELDRHWAPIT